MLNINRKLSQKGFSLIELMVAVVILAMAIFGIFNAYSVGFMGMVDARNVTVATNYAREEMENIKNTSFGNLVASGVEAPFTIPAPTIFSGTKTIKIWNGNSDLKEVTTKVSWNDRNEIPKEVKLETLIYNND